MQNSAVRLLDLGQEEIEVMATEIIFGQLRLTVASLTIEDINQDREKFLMAIRNNIEPELRKIGLTLINVNITDITDESGYIESIGKKAASNAINQAKVDVAENTKHGEVGSAQAERERRIQVSKYNSEAVEGENTAQANIAGYNADLAEKSAEAEGIKKVLDAKAGGYKDLVTSTGNAKDAATMLLVEKLEEIVKMQAEAIKNIKIDKVTVWDSGSENGSSTSNFLNSMVKSLPALHDVAEMAGVELPDYLGKTISDDKKEVE